MHLQHDATEVVTRHLGVQGELKAYGESVGTVNHLLHHATRYRHAVGRRWVSTQYGSGPTSRSATDRGMPLAMDLHQIRDISDWDARSRAAQRALTAELKADAPDLPKVLDLVEILAGLALDFAGDDQGPRASRLRARCVRTLQELEGCGDAETRERVALCQLRVTRVTRGVFELSGLVARLRSDNLDAWSEPALAVLDAFDAHCLWESRARDDARGRMMDAIRRLAPYDEADGDQWLADYAWACGRLAYWFNIAELQDDEFVWLKRAIDALSRQLKLSPTSSGSLLLGLHEEKLGRLHIKRGELEAAAESLDSAFAHVSDWPDVAKDVRGALRSVAKKRRRRDAATSV